MADNELRPTRATPVGPGDPVEAEAVTGRPQDEPLPNTTFADRAKARSRTSKAVSGDTAENKAVRKAARK